MIKFLIKFAHGDGQDIVPESFHWVLTPFFSIFIVGLALVIYLRVIAKDKPLTGHRYRLGIGLFMMPFLYFAYNEAKLASLLSLLISLTLAIKWIVRMGKGHID